MKVFGSILLAVGAAAAGAAAAMYAMKKREEIEQFDYDFDDEDELYFDECECDCDCCGDADDLSELDSLDADVAELTEEDLAEIDETIKGE
ncbi:MAG: hypothetical protein J6K17_04655 [Oscillospiraceae bacterium]|nr:hypothetical protein [Oscillospiraceae bacterium]